MDQQKVTFVKSYEEFLSEGRGKVNLIMDRVLMIIVLIGPLLALGKMLNIFAKVTYAHIAIVFAVSIALSLCHHVVIKLFAVSENAALLVLMGMDLLMILMSELHFCVSITLFMVPIVSIIYYSMPIYFIACILNYISVVIIFWTTSAYYAANDMQYVGNPEGWFVNRISGFTLETLLMVAAGYFVVKVVTASSKRLYLSLAENKLDNMTGILNRKAFEEDKYALKMESLPGDLILFYIDINSLKIINDDKGHVSGDELINGAAICLTDVLAKYGKIYRVGGDEFISVIRTDLPAAKLVDDLHDRVMSWSGEMVDSLKLSIGYASVAEGHAPTFDGLEKVAEQMMYADKARFYSESGFDRRRNR